LSLPPSCSVLQELAGNNYKSINRPDYQAEINSVYELIMSWAAHTTRLSMDLEMAVKRLISNGQSRFGSWHSIGESFTNRQQFNLLTSRFINCTASTITFSNPNYSKWQT